MKYKMKMELLSDLCPASGESIAGVIDTEVNFDDFGFPYIPAKRIKGCLRESAIEIRDLLGKEFNTKAFNNLFGIVGSSNGANLIISDGYLEGYVETKKEFSEIVKDKKYKEFLKKQDIKEIFTNTRTQTKINIETGSAQENSLRVSRTINKGNVFYFELKVINEDKDEIELLSNCCKILRRIGLNRTRGYGEVKCELLSSKSNENDIIIRNKNSSEEKFLEYVIELQSQTIISSKGSQSTMTENYIPGSNVLGYFASRYLQVNKAIDKQNAHKESEFNSLFINGEVKFSNAYITSIDNYGKYIDFLPCPASIVKEKNEDNYYNKIQENEEDLLDVPVKKMQNAYININEYDDFYLNNIITELEYHHKRPKDRTIGHALGSVDNQEGGGEFYQYNVLKKGQKFKGRIYASNENLDKIFEIIPMDGIINIGRSKTAQYAKVSFELIDIDKPKIDKEDIYIKSDEAFMVHLTSPMILLNKYGHYEPNTKILINNLEKILNEPNSICVEKSFLKFKNISGFNSKWMLPKENILGLDCGSIIKVKYVGNKCINISLFENNSYGMRKNEGFGSIRVYKDMGYNLEKIELEHGYKEIEEIQNFIKSILHINADKLLINELKAKAIEKTTNNEIKISNNFLNKMYTIMLMSEDIPKFLKDMEELRNKKTQTKKVDQAIEAVFKYDNLSKKIIDKMEKNKISDYCKDNLLKDMKRDILDQCKISKDIKSIEKNINLGIEDVKTQNKYLKIYFTEILHQLKLAGRKG